MPIGQSKQHTLAVAHEIARYESVIGERNLLDDYLRYGGEAEPRLWLASDDQRLPRELQLVYVQVEGRGQDGDGLGVGAPDGVGVVAVGGEGFRGAVEAGEADLVVGGGPEVEGGRADGEEVAAEDAEEDHAVGVPRVERDRLRPAIRHVHLGGGGGGGGVLVAGRAPRR